MCAVRTVILRSAAGFVQCDSSAMPGSQPGTDHDEIAMKFGSESDFEIACKPQLASATISHQTKIKNGMTPETIRAVVIDDDDFVRDVVVRQLTVLGAGNVQSARDWSQAMSLLRADPACNLVVTDLDMPGVVGGTFLRELSEIHPGIGLILASGLAPAVLRAAEKQARKLPLRVLGSIAKPTSVKTLRAMLLPPA